MVKAYLGCAIPTDKGEWFVQLVGEGALFGRPILSNARAIGREAAIERALEFAGATELAGIASVVRAVSKSNSIGIKEAMRHCAEAMEDLTWTLKSGSSNSQMQLL